MWTESEAVTNLVSADAQTRRLRLSLEGSREVKLGGGSVLTPSLEVGLRFDAGDAETGSGVELGGGLRWTNSGGLTMEVRARGLIAHEERDYEEWGMSASLALSPGEGARGLSMRVGYELDAMRGLLTPYTGLSLSSGGETWRAGARFRFGPSLDLNLEASLTEPEGDGEHASGLVLRASKRW